MQQKQQKMIKIKPKNTILMSEKISVILINKGFSQKLSIKTRIETLDVMIESHNLTGLK